MPSPPAGMRPGRPRSLSPSPRTVSCWGALQPPFLLCQLLLGRLCPGGQRPEEEAGRTAHPSPPVSCFWERLSLTLSPLLPGSSRGVQLQFSHLLQG